MEISSLLHFAILNGVLMLSCTAFAYRRINGATESLLTLATYAGFFWLTSIIAILTIAGWCNLLRPDFLTGAGYFSSVVFLIYSDLTLFRERHTIPVSVSGFLVAILLPLVALLSIESFNGLINPVWEFDSIAYHMPMVRHWFLTESMRDVFFSVFAGPVNYYPGSGELLNLWSVTMLSNDSLANLINVVVFVLCALTSLHLTQRLGLSLRGGAMFLLLFLFSPIVWKEVGTPHVDLFFALSFLYLILFLWEYAQTKNLLYLFLSALGLGLFIGTKYLALPFAILPSLVAIALVVSNIRTIGLRSLVTITLFGLMGVVLMGGHFYLRNYHLTGNPIFPAELTLAGHTYFEGYTNLTDEISNRSILNNIDVLTGIEQLDLLLQIVKRMGYQLWLMAAGFVLALVSLFWSGLTSQFSKRDVFMIVLLLSIPLFVLIYLAAPNSFGDFDHNIRYAILLLITLGLLTVIASEKLKLSATLEPVAVILVYLSIWHAITLTDLPHEPLTVRFIQEYGELFLPYLSRIAGLSILVIILLSRGWWQRAGIIIVTLFLPLIILSGNEDIVSAKKSDYYALLQSKYPLRQELFQAFKWIDENTSTDDRIAYSGFSSIYPLMGKSLNRSVSYISINGCQPCTYADLYNSKDGILSYPNANQWMANLRNEGITYLILYNQFGYMKYEPEWIAERPRDFTRVFNEDEVSIYRIEK